MAKRIHHFKVEFFYPGCDTHIKNLLPLHWKSFRKKMVFLAIKTLTRKKVKWRISKIIETFNLIVMKKCLHNGCRHSSYFLKANCKTYCFVSFKYQVFYLADKSTLCQIKRKKLFTQQSVCLNLEDLCHILSFYIIKFEWDKCSANSTPGVLR